MVKTVLITGASGQIGGGLARAFAAAGYNLVLCGRSRPQVLQALCGEINAQGGSAVPFVGDAADPREVDRMFRFAQDSFGFVDTLVYGAGVAQSKPFTDITPDDWDEMLRVNATGAFLCSQRAAGEMIRRKRGCIITVSSMWGQVGAACEVHYSAAKAAMIGLTKALAKELAPSGIRVNCLAPGAVQGGMMDAYSEEDAARLCGEIPMGRLGTPEEVAAAAVFLASDAAAYLTGQVLAPNGGFVV